ncbi:hypothetical protein CVT25_012289 [Psilocybe cyanescens]|uniref:RNase III domain-containing protein n=1 Tax=Psilocybe cyanescens TaxID=93625 RepID=A0A409W2L1_PSICY|nr:hypothetical protein CVT25_012289 [Psilocybe cyanescens]
MSSATRCLSSSLRLTTSAHSSSSLACARTLIPGARTYGQTAFQQREPPRRLEDAAPRRMREERAVAQSSKFNSKQWRQHGVDQSENSNQESENTEPQESRVPPHFAEYMDRLFSPLQFPPELAQRVLTHNSHALARRGHNAGLSFIGRRVLSTYLLLFLQSSPNLSPSHDTEEIVSNTLHTNLLGEHVGHEWGVGQVLIWQPAASSTALDGARVDLKVLRAAGLYKVQGEAVQAMIGAIYQQYGASAALKVFHTQLLPLLRVKGGLPRAFYEHVDVVSRKMGGEPMTFKEPEVKKTVVNEVADVEADTPVKVET